MSTVYYCYNITENPYYNTVYTTTTTIDVGVKLYNAVPEEIGYINFIDEWGKASINWSNGQTTINEEFTSVPDENITFTDKTIKTIQAGQNVYKLFYPTVDYNNGINITSVQLPYTATSSGLLVITFNVTTATASNFSLTVNNIQVAYMSTDQISRQVSSYLIAKGDVLDITTNATSSNIYLYPYIQQ